MTLTTLINAFFQDTLTPGTPGTYGVQFWNTVEGEEVIVEIHYVRKGVWIATLGTEVLTGPAEALVMAHFIDECDERFHIARQEHAEIVEDNQIFRNWRATHLGGSK